MDAPWPARDALWQPIDGSAVRRLMRAAQLSLFALLAVGGAVVIARRVGGALGEPLPPAALIAVAAVLAAGAMAFRHLVGPAMAGAGHLARYSTWAAATLVLLVWAAGLLVPGTSAVGVLGLVGLLAAEEAWCWWHVPTGKPATMAAGVGQPGTLAPVAGVFDPGGPASPSSATADVAVVDPSPAEVDRDASQWIVRRRDESGGETMEGWVRAGFVASQRHANAHLAICPPFGRTPICYAEQSDGPPAQVKVGQVLPYGVRIEIKLDRAATEPCDVTIEFSIQEQEQ